MTIDAGVTAIIKAAIIEAEELLERQAGQELRLSELLGAEAVPLWSDGLTGRVVGDL